MRRAWHEPFDGGRLPLAGLLAACVALVLNLGLREVSVRWLAVGHDQAVLSTMSVVTATLIGIVLAMLALAVFGHTQPRPFSVFRRFALAAFLLSCLGPVLAFYGALPGVGQVDSRTMGVLLGMNAVVLVAVLSFFMSIPRGRSYPSGY